MAALQCDICGGKLIGRPGGIFECDSCGMEYDTAWAKAKIQEIKGTVKVEGTVEVTGTVKLDGPVKVEGGATIENLLKRGYMQLEDRKWESATDTFNEVLGIDSENGRACLGLAMAKCEIGAITTIDKVMTGAGNSRNALLKYDNNFKRAEKFADPELKEMFIRWNKLRDEYYAAREAERKAREDAELREKQTEEEQLAKLKLARERTAKFKGMIDVSFGHIIGLKTDGTVLTAGQNNKGQRGTKHFEDIVAVCCNDSHSVGLRSDGTVAATEYTGDYGDYAGRCDVQNWKNIAALSTISHGTFGITKDGHVLIAGKPLYHNEDSAMFEGVRNWTDIVDIKACITHALGLKKNGTVVADVKYRHDNAFGNITIVSPKDKPYCAVSGWQDIVAIAAGSTCSIGLKADGTVVTTKTAGDHSKIISKWTDIVDIAADQITAGLKADGTVVTDSSEHESVKSWTDIVAISVAYSTLIGLKSDGTVVIAGGFKDNPTAGWKLFDSADTLEEERLEARKLLEEKKAAAIRERRQQLENERKALEQEKSNLKGIFASIRRMKINDRLEEIEYELKGLK